MIEQLPSSEADMQRAWEQFPWIPRDNADGPRSLPIVSEEEKQNMLQRSATAWLGEKVTACC